MPRKSLGPRLYLDPRRQQWVIRDGEKFVRTGLSEKEQAGAALRKYIIDKAVPTGFIYFMTAAYPDFPIKIGFTVRIGYLRLRGLQTGCPYALYFIGQIPGTILQEQEIHKLFGHIRLGGEWFRNTTELQSYIRGVCPDAIKAA